MVKKAKKEKGPELASPLHKPEAWGFAHPETGKTTQVTAKSWYEANSVARVRLGCESPRCTLNPCLVGST